MQILGRSRRQTEDPDQEKYKHCDNQLVEIQRVDKWGMGLLQKDANPLGGQEQLTL